MNHENPMERYVNTEAAAANSDRWAHQVGPSLATLACLPDDTFTREEILDIIRTMCGVMPLELVMHSVSGSKSLYEKAVSMATQTDIFGD